MIPLNTQKVERVSYSEQGILDVVNVWQTIQGEGPFAGFVSTFVRLAGCNLQCPGCDTDYTSSRQAHTPEDLLAVIEKVSRGPAGMRNSGQHLVVITGGEPFRQNLTPLVRLLGFNNYHVQIETNGTLFDQDFSYLRSTIVCSPKAGKVNEHLQDFVTVLKYVVRAGEVDPEDGLPTSVLGGPRPARPWNARMPIYLQPMDEGDVERNKDNLRAAVGSCLQFGYILGMQIHKIAGLE